ncbi:insulin-like growth factor-binding protein 6b [Amia ocellicauda]|uniref:insulin-like growth factor-binding protein 6 n=1 Tax=Amia ocellicauda TaxID=2972642 RepID=UPI0034643685
MPTLPRLPALLLTLACLRCLALSARLPPPRGCPSCREAGAARGLREPSAEGSTATLGIGEPCGVYTLSCAKGLRCVPTPGERSPLQALLQGRGICTRNLAPSKPKNRTTGPPVVKVTTGNAEENAPCRQLLNAVLLGLKPTVFQPPNDIYIPNCDTRGFYRKMQCRSSKGTQRGECWCVDELGQLLPSPDRDPATLRCERE